MIGALRSTGADVITMGLMDITRAGIIPEKYAMAMSTGIRRLAAVTQEVATRHGALHISFTDHPAGDDPGVFSVDRLHLNARGHAIVAAETIRRLAAHPHPSRDLAVVRGRFGVRGAQRRGTEWRSGEMPGARPWRPRYWVRAHRCG